MNHLLAGLVAVGIAIGQPTSDVRRIPYRPGTDIVAALRTSDKVLEVVRETSPPFIGPSDDPVKEVEALTPITDAILVIKVLDKQPQITAERDWIDSLIRAVVVEVLKKPDDQALTAGQSLQLTERGGELRTGGRTILASVPWAKRSEEQRDYLVFLMRRKAGGWGGLDPTSTFAIEGSTLQRLRADTRPMGIEKSSTDLIRAHIRAIAGSHRK